MCVIMTCKPNARPSFEVLEAAFVTNPDGAGIAWSDGGAVHVEKGFYDVDALASAIARAPKASPLVIHMRIATSGGVSVGTCHPFPITDRLDDLHASTIACSAAIAHNGVIAGVATDERRGISDTVAFTAGVVSGLWRDGRAPSRRFRERVRRLAPNNRFAIIDARGGVYRIGRGWLSVTGGIEASNDLWRAYVWRPSWGSLIDDGDGYDDGLDYVPYGYEDEYSDVVDAYCGPCELADYCARRGPLCDGIGAAADSLLYGWSTV